MKLLLVAGLVLAGCAGDEEGNEVGRSVNLTVNEFGSNFINNGPASNSVMSSNALYVAYETMSDSLNAIPADANGLSDIKVLYRGPSSPTGDGEFYNSLRWVSRGNQVAGTPDGLLHLVMPTTGSSMHPSISSDGQLVAFQSNASNLPAQGATNKTTQIFVSIRHKFGEQHSGDPVDAPVSYLMKLISVNPKGSGANDISANPAVSGDGRFVAFESLATDLVAGDTNGVADVFLADLTTGKITLVSVDSSGKQLRFGGTNPCISGDGRFVGFTSFDASHLMQVYVFDTGKQVLEQVGVSSSNQSAGHGVKAGYRSVSMSGDGMIIGFQSDSTNLVASDTNAHTDVFLRNRGKGTTTLASQNNGVQGNGDSLSPSVSFDGLFIAFSSVADDWVVNGIKDTNGNSDTFVLDLTTGRLVRSSVTWDRRQAEGGGSYMPSLVNTAAFGPQQSFQTNCPTIGQQTDTNGLLDIAEWQNDRDLAGNLL